MGKCLFMRKGETHTAPISGILASDLAVGSSVYLMENGVATEYLVVNQGIPEQSSLYDASCDGLWLLRKDIKENRQWHSSNVNDYANSTIHTWLNSDFFNLFGSVEQDAIKQVKIPYRSGSGTSFTPIMSGESGLSSKIFLLSAIEVGLSNNYDSPKDGSLLSYFDIGTGATACNKRVGYNNGSVVTWWLRSPYCDSDYPGRAWNVYTDGGNGNHKCNISYGIRPALVLPSTALFDKNTLILKGVA